MKFIRQLNITKMAYDVLDDVKKKHLNSLDKISNGMLCDIAILKVYNPEKLLLLNQVKEYRELINVLEK